MFGKNKKAAQHLTAGDVIVVAGVKAIVVSNDPTPYGRAIRDIVVDPDPDSTTAQPWERKISIYIPSYLMVTYK